MKAKTTAALLMALLLTGCAAVSMGGRHVATVYAANDVFPTETSLVVRDQAAWQNLWAEMNKNLTPPPALPAVDFTNEMLLVAAAGTRPSGGYSIVIKDAVETAGTITVHVTITSPGQHCFVTPALTSPVDIVAVPQREQVSFNITNKVRDCS